jgi:hypothetical protein
MHTATLSSNSYDFRKDFDCIARPGLIRYLKHLGYGVDLDEGDDPNDFDLTYYTDAKQYLRRLWKALEEAQEFCELGLAAPCNPQITSWTRESAVALTNERLEDMIGYEADTKPVDIHRAVRLGIEMAQKQNAGGNLPFAIDTGPEAIHYATDCLKSKVERDACGNPITEVHNALLSYRYLKEMHNGGNVVYIDHYKRRKLSNLPIRLTPDWYRARQAATAAFRAAGERWRAEQQAKHEEAPEPKPATMRAAKRLPSALDGVAIGRRADWTDVGGILAKMRDHVLATAPYPNRPLATMSALATLSAVCGSRVYSPTGLTLAIYLVMLAETGEGKDAALKAPSRFLHSANLGLMAQPGKTFTVSGFEQCLIDSQGACVATCDEVGESLLKKVLSKKAMSFETAIKTFLMELSGREDHNPPFALTKRAANGVDGKNIVHSIPGASFTLFGASTPAAFYEALSYGNVGDGSLNRFIVINADPSPDYENIVDRIIPVPQAISDALEGIAGTSFGVTFAGGRAWPLIESERADWAPRARERYELLAKQMKAVLRSKPPFVELYARVKANALKVATLLAVSRAVESGELLVTVDDIENGAALALESATVTIDGAMKHMAGSEFEGNCKAILKAVNASDDSGLTSAKLHSKPGISKIKPRDFKDAVEFLVRTGQMVTCH